MVRIFEKLGSWSNGIAIICLFHCMAMPVIIAVLPAIGMFYIPSWLDKGIILLAVLLSLVSLCWGYKTHGRIRAFALLFAATIWLWLAHDPSAGNSMLYSLVGASCMFAANFMNRKLCKTCEHCKEGHL